MHTIHFPQGTLSFLSYELSDWGSKLHGRYISVQECSTERGYGLSWWFIPQPRALQEHVVNPIGITFGLHQSTELEKKKDSCLQIQMPFMFFDEPGIKKSNLGLPLWYLIWRGGDASLKFERHLLDPERKAALCCCQPVMLRKWSLVDFVWFTEEYFHVSQIWWWAMLQIKCANSIYCWVQSFLLTCATYTLESLLPATIQSRGH